MFSQSAHVHLIDALMTAYMLEMISAEKVVSSVKRFSNLSAKELPFDLEDAMLLWINKVSLTHLIRLLASLFSCWAAASFFSFLFPGEHENEGDLGKRAEDETPSAGVSQSPEGNPRSCCLKLLWCPSAVFVAYFTAHFLNGRLTRSGVKERCTSLS